MTASHPVFKPVTLPDFQNGNDSKKVDRVTEVFVTSPALMNVPVFALFS